MKLSNERRLTEELVSGEFLNLQIHMETLRSAVSFGELREPP